MGKYCLRGFLNGNTKISYLLIQTLYIEIIEARELIILAVGA